MSMNALNCNIQFYFYFYFEGAWPEEDNGLQLRFSKATFELEIELQLDRMPYCKIQFVQFFSSNFLLKLCKNG